MPLAKTVTAGGTPGHTVAPVSLSTALVTAIPDLTAAATGGLITNPATFNSESIVPMMPSSRFRIELIPVWQYPDAQSTIQAATTVAPVVQLVGIDGAPNKAGDGLHVDDIALIGEPIDIGTPAHTQIVHTVPNGDGARGYLPPVTPAPGVDVRGFPLVFASIVTPATVVPISGDPVLSLLARFTN